MSPAYSEGAPGERLRGLVFTRQYPNPAEPVRGVFVADQVSATSADVDWRVIAPVPWAPSALAAATGRPHFEGDARSDGTVRVAHPRYAVLPRRLLYTTVARSMAASSRSAFDDAIAGLRPDFVHAHELYPSGAAASALVAGSLPLVVTAHGSDLYANLARPAWREQLVRVAEAATMLIGVSSRIAADLVAETGADPARVRVIPDCYDDRLFGPLVREPRRGPMRLISVGRLVDVKGHAHLIDAVATLVRGGLDVRLTLVGGGPLESRLRERAYARGLDGRFDIVADAARASLPGLLADADVFVLPSLSEGFGVALVEAIATGLPAVATDCGGPADIVTPATGTLVAPGDAAALADGIADVAGRLASFDPGSLSADVNARFGREAVAARLVEAYREACA